MTAFVIKTAIFADNSLRIIIIIIIIIIIVVVVVVKIVIIVIILMEYLSLILFE